MRLLLLILGILVGTAELGSSAEAQNYPWCAIYGGGMGGATNCGFTTFQQCMATVSGMGGFCQPNTQYQPATTLAPGHWVRRKSHTHS